MFEFHGWVVIRSGFDLDDPRYEEDWIRMWPQLEEELQLFGRPDHFFIHKGVNELVSVTCSGLRNHHQEWVMDFFRWVASRAPGSYGLLYIFDNEDPQYENAFRVHRLAKGELKELDDPFLSPYIPTLEDPDGAPSSIQDKAERAFRMCGECVGSGECIACRGEGKAANGLCPMCLGTGACKNCEGSGLVDPAE